MVHTKRLSEILNIFPVKYIGDSIDKEINDEQNDENEQLKSNQMTIDLIANEHLNSDQLVNYPIKNSDYEYFTHYLKIAVDLDRSERLSEMIKTTGYQLYNTFVGSNSNNVENFNTNRHKNE